MSDDLFQYLLRLADDRLVLGHRTSEWCGHAPILEEDIALANIALDLIGAAQAFYDYAAELEGAKRDADYLAYFRGEREYLNLQLLELPRGSFADTIASHLYFNSYSVLQLGSLAQSKDRKLAALAAKALKESQYHARHSAQWVIRLGDGTAESHQRMQDALDSRWIYTGEFFEQDELELRLVKAGTIPDLSALKQTWTQNLREVLTQATLIAPSDTSFFYSGGRRGIHTEHLGHMLAEMQVLPRSFPDARW